jgi:hypothetical protein
MTQENTLVVGEVGSHAATHHVAALDQRGALLGAECFPTTASGYRQLLDWLRDCGRSFQRNEPLLADPEARTEETTCE